MFPPRVAEKGNSNVLAHFSSIRDLTVVNASGERPDMRGLAVRLSPKGTKIGF